MPRVARRHNRELLRQASCHGYQDDGTGHLAHHGVRAACRVCGDPIATALIGGLVTGRRGLEFVCRQESCAAATLMDWGTRHD